MAIIGADEGKELEEIISDLESALRAAELDDELDTVSLLQSQQSITKKINQLLAERVDELEEAKASREEITDLQDQVQELERELDALVETTKELGRARERHRT